MQYRTDDLPLKPGATAVNQTDFAVPPFHACVKVLSNHVWNIARHKGVQIEAVLDGKNHRRLIVRLRCVRIN